MLIVQERGFLTTVQDAGRPGAAWLGVPRAGACDPDGLAVANLLLGNAPDAAALEVTLAGLRFTVEEPLVIALGGADLGARVIDEDRPLRPGTASLVRAGSVVSFDGGRCGARAYLAVPGGLDVPKVLGSASACAAARFPGLAGRSLQPGDRLAPGRPTDLRAAGRRWPEAAPSPAQPPELRVVAGPHRAALGESVEEVLLGTSWTVREASDRSGTALAGDEAATATLAEAAARLGAIPSLPMTWGAIQLPPGGGPICLGPDHGTLGGYAVPFVIASVDRGTLGQLRPGARVRLTIINVRDARVALMAHRERMLKAAAAVAASPDYEGLADAVG